MWRTMLILVVLCVLPALILPSILATGEQPEASNLSIDELIHRLGNDDYTIREAAAKELTKRPEARGAVKQALKSTDPEVRRRCEVILADMHSNRIHQVAASMRRAAKEGRADLLCCYAQADAEEASLAFWEAFRDLYQSLADRADFQEHHGDHGDATSWRTQVAPNDGSGGFEIVNGQLVPTQVTPHKLSWCMEWSSTTDEAHQAIFADVIKHQGSLGDVKFVCRRDATIDGEALTGAFLCTGNVKMTCANKHRGWLDGVLICDGDLEVPQIYDSLVIARGSVICNNVRNSIVVQDRSKALGIRFFELSDAGIEVTDKGLTEVKELPLVIQELLEKQASARSGFQLGDQLVSVNGKAIESVEQLRRILRQHYVDNSIEPQALPFVVEREGKTMALKLSYQ